MSVKEIEEYQTFYSIFPFGQYRHDHNAGLIASVLANVHRNKDRKAYKPQDFMPYLQYEKELAEQSIPKKDRAKKLFSKILNLTGKHNGNR